MPSGVWERQMCFRALLISSKGFLYFYQSNVFENCCLVRFLYLLRTFSGFNHLFINYDNWTDDVILTCVCIPNIKSFVWFLESKRSWFLIHVWLSFCYGNQLVTWHDLRTYLRYESISCLTFLYPTYLQNRKFFDVF